MKKLISMLLAAVIFVSLTACVKPGNTEGKGSVMTAEEFDKLLEANDVEKLIDKYGSYSITWNENGEIYYLYQGKDFFLNDYGNGSLEYKTYDVRYESRGTEPSDFSLYCVVNVYGEAVERYPFIFCTYEEFVKEEHETFYSKTIVDGYVHYKTVYNEEGAKDVLIDLLGEDKPGWTVYSDLVYNAETYEAVDLVNYMEKDGEEVVIYDMAAGFGEPVPTAVYTLRSVFERQSKNMMTVTYIADHGTDNEAKKTLTVPQNCECSFSVGGVPCVYFTNEDYTAVDRWDRKSDFSFYIVTNPSDELTQRYNTIIASD